MNITEVTELKRKLEEDFKKKTEAIDIVLEMLRAEKGNVNGSAPQVSDAPVSPTPKVASPETKPRRKKGEPTRVRGVLSLTRRLIFDLPPVFTIEDLIIKLHKVNPSKAHKIKRESLRSTLRTLVSEGSIVVAEKAAGTKPASYRIA